MGETCQTWTVISKLCKGQASKLCFFVTNNFYMDFWAYVQAHH